LIVGFFVVEDHVAGGEMISRSSITRSFGGLFDQLLEEIGIKIFNQNQINVTLLNALWVKSWKYSIKNYRVSFSPALFQNTKEKFGGCLNFLAKY
jgi:hypothetical protein